MTGLGCGRGVEGNEFGEVACYVKKSQKECRLGLMENMKEAKVNV